MRFRLLGPLEVAEQHREAVLGGVKPHSLLAILLLHANEVVATDRLISELWSESPPATVAKSVQSYVMMRLRREHVPERLSTRPPGYRSGGQAEALHAYRAARRELADELGLETSDQLRRLERAILQQDPGLEAAQRPARARRRPTARCSSSPAPPPRSILCRSSPAPSPASRPRASRTWRGW